MIWEPSSNWNNHLISFMFRVPGNVRHQVIGPGFGWMGGVVVPIINSDRFTLIFQQKSLREFYCPTKNHRCIISMPMSLAFFWIIRKHLPFVISKNTVPQIYVLKNWPQNANILSRSLGQLPDFSSEVIRSGEQNSWKTHIFSILVFDLKKLSQDLNDEPGMQWTFTFSYAGKVPSQ